MRQEKNKLKTGDKFGKWTVLHRVESAQTSYKCRCDCGTIAIIQKHKLITGSTLSCGCGRLKHKVSHIRGKIILKKGARFQYLRFVKPLQGSGNYGEFECICGKTIRKKISNVIQGHIKSCGCMNLKFPTEDKGSGGHMRCSFIAGRLARSYNLSSKDIPLTLIRAKKEMIKIYDFIKGFQNENNQRAKDRIDNGF